MDLSRAFINKNLVIDSDIRILRYRCVNEVYRYFQMFFQTPFKPGKHY